MKVCVFDTETTGLVKNRAIPLSKQPQIIEIYCDIFEQVGTGKDATFHPMKPYHSLVKVEQPLPDIIKKITNINDAMLVSSPFFKTIAVQVRHAITDVDRLVGHNLQFDTTMLEIEFERANCRVEKWPEKVCTIEATQHFFGYRLNQSKLYEHLFGEKFEGAHRAEADVKALTRIYQRLVQDGVIE
jgi:DNA polymerase III epsilon subunit-like protein